MTLNDKIEEILLEFADMIISSSEYITTSDIQAVAQANTILIIDLVKNSID